MRRANSRPITAATRGTSRASPSTRTRITACPVSGGLTASSARVKAARPAPALDAIPALLADKASRLHDTPAGTSLIPPDADCDEIVGGLEH